MKRLFENQYLTFKILTDGDILWKEMHDVDTVSLSAIAISYSRDNGLTWNDVTSSEEGTAINVHAGEKILFKGNNNTYGYYFYDIQEIGKYINDYCKFEGTASFNLEGNIMSLIYGDNFRDKINLENSNTFSYLFSNSNVVDAKNLKLPATTLTGNCYGYMFYNCSSLESAPELPATTLADYCYFHMFDNCSSLVNAPELPATTLARSCYASMFADCVSLESAPELPATTLARHCYTYMFYGCSSLKSAPELPATTLENYCYCNMFKGCVSLESAPELPATTLAYYCYWSMFDGCSKLNYIKAMFMTTPSGSYTNSWVNGVSSTGTFVKNVAATWDVTGNNGIPSGWTVETASA